MKVYLLKSLFALTLLALLAGLVWPAPAPVQASDPAQNQVPFARARALLASMSPEERVGQLFLVSFQGTDLRDSSPIYRLITNYHIGGVVLSRSNDNFDDRENLVRQVYTLTVGLQQIEHLADQSTPEGSESPTYIPLLIGLSQEGDLYPNDQILTGVSPLPSLMALGATWDPDLAYQTGQALGSELSALGINLYLGPSLDISDGIYREGGNDMGVRSFGGDPYWVSRLGQAYIAGLHAGSAAEGASPRLAVIAKNFPGIGSADRNPQVQIPTVRKSLDQLKRIELAPFYAVTGNAPQPAISVDGLFLTHIRYQGFQGNIRDITTRPISFDQGALGNILKLDPFNLWRSNGGLLVSDNLGSPALRRFFDPTGSNFDARQVARNAMMAGNDLLYADGLVSSADPDAFTTLSRTIDFFNQNYREDAAFAQRVDAAVERILALKYRLYPNFNLDEVLPRESDLARVGTHGNLNYQVASASATLISPDPAELANVLSRPPASNERILFLTDDIIVRQCSACGDQSTVAVDGLQNAVLRLYGTQSGGPISRNVLQSFSFTDLDRIFLPNQTETQPVEESLKLATWIVVLQQQPDPARPASLAFQRLLSERPDLVRNKRIVLFALNAPYYFDATDISKLSAYYGLYSKSAAFIELAARILFQEHIPTGASPVSIPGISYDLVEITRPDPRQIITLSLDQELSTPNQPAAASTQVPTFKLGDTLRLRTSVILDHNQHPVPDGTIVRFSFAVGNEPGLAQIIETQTVDGIGRVAYKIERGELLEITAVSDPAYNSTRLILDITSSGAAAITVIAPTPLPSLTPAPTETPTLTLAPSPTPTPEPPPSTRISDWVFAVILSVGIAAMVTWIGGAWMQARWSLRLGLTTLIGSLLGFNYLALELPGSLDLMQAIGAGAPFLFAVIGAAVGFTAGWLWRWFTLRRVFFAPLPTPSRGTNPPLVTPGRTDTPAEPPQPTSDSD